MRFLFGRVLRLPRLLLRMIWIIVFTISPVMADDWGFGVQTGADDGSLSLNYAVRDSEKSLREWTLGYREYTRRNVAGHTEENGRGWGLGFSWRYYFPKTAPFFLGVRHDWLVMQVAWEEKARPDPGEAETGKTDVHILQPALILGWTPATAKVSADFYFLGGYGFVAAARGESVSQVPALSFGVSLRF